MSLLLFYVLCGAPLCGVLFLLAYFSVFFVRFVGGGFFPLRAIVWLRKAARADMESAPTANHKFCNNARCFGGGNLQSLPCVKGDSPQCGEMSRSDRGARPEGLPRSGWGIVALPQNRTTAQGHNPSAPAGHLPLHKGGFAGCPLQNTLRYCKIYGLP